MDLFGELIPAHCSVWNIPKDSSLLDWALSQAWPLATEKWGGGPGLLLLLQWRTGLVICPTPAQSSHVGSFPRKVGMQSETITCCSHLL